MARAPALAALREAPLELSKVGKGAGVAVPVGLPPWWGAPVEATAAGAEVAKVVGTTAEAAEETAATEEETATEEEAATEVEAAAEVETAAEVVSTVVFTASVEAAAEVASTLVSAASVVGLASTVVVGLASAVVSGAAVVVSAASVVSGAAEVVALLSLLGHWMEDGTSTPTESQTAWATPMISVIWYVSFFTLHRE